MTRVHHVLLALACFAVAGCAQAPVGNLAPTESPAGAATRGAAPKPAVQSIPLALGKVVVGAQPIEQASPVYPSAELSACPARVDVPALLTVNEQGRVKGLHIKPATSPVAMAFLDAIRSATSAWRFEPLYITHMAADANGNAHVVDQATRAFSLSYVFHFYCLAGHGSVSMSAVAPD